MLTIYTVGTLGYYFLGHGKWRLADCAYMTVISLTTVGYGEILADLDKMAYARLFTAFLLVGGAGIAVYFLSVLTTYLVEGEFLERRRSKKMRKIVDNLSGHIIVCGGGGTGRHVVEELMATRWSFVLVDTDAEKLERFQEEHDNQLPVIQGDATDDHVLLDAGIKRAHGIVASLPDDKGNLYVVVTARGLNPKLRIVSKAVEADATRKITAAGADAVISVNAIGGLRMASEMIRPQVVTFLDKMMRDKDKKLRFEEVTIPERSPLVDKKLAQTDIRRERNLLIVAARGAEGTYVYSPGPDFVLQAGMTLILLGETDSVQRLRGSSMFQWEDEDPSR
jgi:voltage-gated potassium channel